MRPRTNPWPSFTDLFSATLIATFAGMIMISAAYQGELKNCMEREQKVAEVRTLADNLVNQVQQSLQGDSTLNSRTSKCGDDTCIDIDIHFKGDSSLIERQNELALLESACKSLKSALDRLPNDQLKEIEVVIEGHTDDRPPQKLMYPRNAEEERAKYLYNWNLSAERATSVSYEFQKCGLTPRLYRIVAIGYANSDPRCIPEETDKCRAENRRTTLRLRGDTRQIEKRLNEQRLTSAGERGDRTGQQREGRESGRKQI